MKNTMKKYGFIALLMVAAVIAIGFTACEEPEEVDVWIEVDAERIADGGYTYNGAVLKIKFDPTTVTLGQPTWTKGGTPVPVAAVVGGDLDTSKDGAGAGDYTLSVKAGSETKTVKITVLATASKNAPKYLGNWKMNATDPLNAAWQNQAEAKYKDKNEDLEILFDSFKLTSEIPMASSSTGFEHLHGKISVWEDFTAPANIPDGFDKFGVKLTLANVDDRGYNTTNTSTIYLFTNDDGRIRRFNATTGANNPINVSAPIARSYVRN